MNGNKNAGSVVWWTPLSAGEKKLLRHLMGVFAVAKRSRHLDVVRAAHKWGPGIACFVKHRLIKHAEQQMRYAERRVGTRGPQQSGRLTARQEPRTNAEVGTRNAEPQTKKTTDY